MDNIKTFIAGFYNFSAFVLCFLLFLYPMFEFILGILSTFFPKLWPNTYSANWITDFAIKYLPYSFHPNCDKFSFFMANIIILILGAKLVEDEHFYIGCFLGGVLLYSFFDEQLFDLITGFAGFIGDGGSRLGFAPRSQSFALAALPQYAQSVRYPDFTLFRPYANPPNPQNKAPPCAGSSHSTF